MTDYSKSSHMSRMPSESFHQYLDDIHSIPLLSAEEERFLAKQCAMGDSDAIRRMVKSNLRLVIFVAREYAGQGVPLLDLIQEGSIGLLTAARKFDYSKDYRFSTYATKWIRQGILRCLLSNGCIIHVPLHTAEKIRAIETERKRLFQLTGEEPTYLEISKHLGLSPAQIEELMQRNPEIHSLDLSVGESDKNTFLDLVEDRKALQPHESLVRNELEKAMHTMLESLTERQQKIICLHFGLENGKAYSLAEIGAALGISKERVRQIERQAMNQLKKMGTGMGLEEFLYE